MSRRSESLANRIEEGADVLAAFAESLTDAEWQTPQKGNDKRTVGVIVHHVASIYPVEMDVVRVIAGGKPLTDVTWQAVAELNANHAKENANATKADTLALLRKNSRVAAAEVRGFTDEELDQAAPFSLSYGAPMTAQFAVEDHPLRHPWHHLYRIRALLGR